MQAMTSNRAAISARLEALSRHCGAKLLDFSASPISAHKELFHNSQHLNARGAEGFTHELAAMPEVAALTSHTR